MACTQVAVEVAAASVVGTVVMPESKTVLPQEVSALMRTVPMAFEPAGSAAVSDTLLVPAMEATSSRPLASTCTWPNWPLVYVGSVVLNTPPTAVPDPGAAPAKEPTEAFEPPPPDCCICAQVGTNVSVLSST